VSATASTVAARRRRRADESVDIQGVVTSVAPWVAAGGGLLTAATAVGRAFGTRRLRAEIRSTADLLSLLPGEQAATARAELEKLLELQVQRLHQRTREGIQLNPRQAMLAYAAGVLLAGLLMVALLALVGLVSKEQSDTFDKVVIRVGAVWAALAVGLGTLLFTFTLIAMAEEWIDRRVIREPTGQRTVADRILHIVFFPAIFVVRRIEQRRSRREATPVTDG
jgi:hypothetical protein